MSLNDEIQEMQWQMLEKAPPGMSDMIDKAVAEMIVSGAAEKALKVGSKAPEFALPNLRGKTVRLSEVLSKGPAVVTFYRGSW